MYSLPSVLELVFEDSGSILLIVGCKVWNTHCPFRVASLTAEPMSTDTGGKVIVTQCSSHDFGIFS